MTSAGLGLAKRGGKADLGPPGGQKSAVFLLFASADPPLHPNSPKNITKIWNYCSLWNRRKKRNVGAIAMKQAEDLQFQVRVSGPGLAQLGSTDIFRSFSSLNFSHTHTYIFTSLLAKAEV